MSATEEQSTTATPTIDYDSTFVFFEEGDVVSGKVVRIDRDEVLVDIGYKSEGVIPVSELSIRRSVNPADEVTLGDEIDALVLTKEDAEGRLILSKKRARVELAWKNIERAAESGEPVNGRVIEVVKGGLILDLGVRGFLPASLVDIRRVQDLDEFLGQELRAKVIELNRSRNNVVLSRRAVLEDERKEMRQAILDRLNPGDMNTLYYLGFVYENLRKYPQALDAYARAYEASGRSNADIKASIDRVTPFAKTQ